MDLCPPEVLHHIFRKLEFAAVAALRLTGRKYAAVGAEYLASRIRFHTSEASVERLKACLEHPVFKQYIKTLIFEGTILADVGCEHSFASHWDLPHHQDEKPTPPAGDSTQRERRLYERNLAKFERDVAEKYKRYRDMYTSQQSLLGSETYQEIIGTCTRDLPKLENVMLTNVGRCKHALSERFLNTFAVSCAMPLDSDTDNTIAQLKMLLFPGGKPRRGLKSLTANILDPEFFLLSHQQPEIASVFKSLKKIKINFRMSRIARLEYDYEDLSFYEKLSGGGLCKALEAAADLEELEIGFDECGYVGPIANLKTILGDVSWSKLKRLDVDCLYIDSVMYLSDALKRQPSLKSLYLAFTVLLSGTWPEAVKQMRDKLDLNDFSAYGFLEDETMLWNMHYIDTETYVDDGLEISMSDRLDMYVTDKDYMNGIDDLSPLEDCEYQDPDDLKEELGQLDEEMSGIEDSSDITSHVGCATD